MKTYLITGAAGFIGSNYLKYVLRLYKNIKVIVLDELTYAGNLGTIKENIQDKRVNFEKGNIKDQVLVKELISKYNIDYIVNFAAESHVDRSIENPQIFLETNILGAQNLMECAKAVWRTGEDKNGYPIYKEGVKYLFKTLGKKFATKTFLKYVPVVGQASAAFMGRQMIITSGRDYVEVCYRVIREKMLKELNAKRE